MQNAQDLPSIFANTGVQLLCFPLRAGIRFNDIQVGEGWQRCFVGDKVSPRALHFIQWQVVRGQEKLFLAIDTTVGPDEVDQDAGYFCKQSAMQQEALIEIERLLGKDGEPLVGIDPVAFVIRSAVAEGGEPKDIHLVVDFGNNRTGGLLIEFAGDVRQEPLMNPLQLVHRYHLDSWDEKGDLRRDANSWWFSSRSQWCTHPYLDPPRIEKEIHEDVVATGWFGGGKRSQKKSVFVTPTLFQDFSQIRMGQEAYDLSLIMNTEGEVRTGLSSPKRYLWAKDASWLEGSNWYMADPSGRVDPQRHAGTLRGPLLRYIPEDDLADLPEAEFDESPARPRHAPRTLMTAALYEILCQAYLFVNSPTYRRAAGESLRMRRIQSLTLTYPSGMILPERERLQLQAVKAAHIFSRSLGAKQVEPAVHLSIDEASAVHLTYIWSEIQKLGRRPSLWFELMGRRQGLEAGKVEASGETADPSVASAQSRSSGTSRPSRPGRLRSEGDKPAKGAVPEVCVACIDIGGGTTDLMIARYSCDTKGAADRISGKTLYRDGIYLAGDYLVKRLLEHIIVPHFAETFSFEPREVQRFFGPETRFTKNLRTQRVLWMNRLFVPLAQRYLQYAVDDLDDDDREITHTDDELVAPEVLASLQEVLNKEMGAGNAPPIRGSLNLYYDRQRFDEVVYEVFNDLIMDFCESINEHNADVVLLAGLPTKLRCIRELVETYLPLSKSRIIPMFKRYVGTWYPYQDPTSENPGEIVDPKSTVVVGAAIEFAARHGMLSQFKFTLEDTAAHDSFYWGVMTDLRIDEEKVLLRPEARPLEGQPRGATKDQHECHVDMISEAVIIGRKRRQHDHAPATPVYVIKVLRGTRAGEIDLRVTLRREREKGEEKIEAVAVKGRIGNEEIEETNQLTVISCEPRTLIDERYYLDVGGLDKIEFDT